MSAAPVQRPIPAGGAILWRPAIGSSVGAGEAYALFVTPKILAAIHAHWRGTPEHGVLGFLVGNLCRDPATGAGYVVVDSIIRLTRPVYGDRVGAVVGSLWDRILAEVANLEGQLLGWYHSHPPAGVGLAPGDLETHGRHFTDPWQLALVLGDEATGPAAAVLRPGPDVVSPTRHLPFFELAEAATGAAKRSSMPWTNFVTSDAVTYEAHDVEAVSAAADRPTLEVTGREAVPSAPVEPARLPVTAGEHARSRVPGDMPVLFDEPLARDRGVVLARPSRRSKGDGGAGATPRAGRARRRVIVVLLLLGALAAAAWRTGWLRLGSSAAPAVTDPAISRYDRLGDSVALSVTAYTELVPPFDSSRIGCGELQQGLVAVEERWIAYNQRGLAPLAALDARRANGDQWLYAMVDAVDRHFAGSGCTRP